MISTDIAARIDAEMAADRDARQCSACWDPWERHGAQGDCPQDRLYIVHTEVGVFVGASTNRRRAIEMSMTTTNARFEERDLATVVRLAVVSDRGRAA